MTASIAPSQVLTNPQYRLRPRVFQPLSALGGDPQDQSVDAPDPDRRPRLDRIAVGPASPECPLHEDGAVRRQSAPGLSDESDLLLQGRWWGQAPGVDGVVYLADGTAPAGSIVRARVTQAADYDLAASLEL